MRSAGPAILLLSLSACTTTGVVASSDPYYVRHAMQAEVNPAIMAIWDVTNNAMNEEGGIEPALVDEAQWNALAQSSAVLESSGREMEAAPELRAAHPDNWATSEHEVTMDQVQAALDADPEGFRRFAAEFADHSARLRLAALARDAATTGELVAQMDATCASCHAQYWYAE
jgi:cytochrome c556